MSAIMSVKENYEVRKIRHKETYPFLLKIHYSRRTPNICHSFGLFDLKRNLMVGVITFGLPPSPTEQTFWKGFNFLELNRLCLIKQLKRNVLSFFVSSSLNKLPKNTIVISYSDKDYYHNGYIYQATNWIYTGVGSIGVKRFLMKDGSERHARHQNLIIPSKVKEIKKSSGKHRYYYFVGDKKQKKKFMNILTRRFEILPYPKGKNENYLIKDKILLQKDLNNFLEVK